MAELREGEGGSGPIAIWIADLRRPALFRWWSWAKVACVGELIKVTDARFQLFRSSISLQASNPNHPPITTSPAKMKTLTLTALLSTASGT